MDKSKERWVEDPIYGYMFFPDFLWQVIDTPEFQRLRWIRQLGNVHHVYPGATHTRFAHSLGVAHLAAQATSKLTNNPHEREIVQLAALLHDIGHGAYSHLLESEIYPRFDIHTTHEQFGWRIISEYLIPRFPDQKWKFEMAMEILQNKTAVDARAKPWMHQLICAPDEKSFDIDRADYIVRDCYYTGIPCPVEVGRIIAHLMVREPSQNLHWCDKVNDNIDVLLNTRLQLHKKVYQHPKVRAMDALIVFHALAQNLQIPKQHMTMTDPFIDVIIAPMLDRATVMPYIEGETIGEGTIITLTSSIGVKGEWKFLIKKVIDYS